MFIPDWVVDLVAVVAVAISVVALFVSIIVPNRAYRQTRKIFWIQLLNSLVDNFFTPEMFSAERDLRNYREERGRQFAEDYARGRRDYASLTPGDQSRIANLDRGRRLIKSYFYRVHQLRKNNGLDDQDIQSYVHDQQVEVLLGILLPIERAITGEKAAFHDDDKEMYEYYRDKYPRAKERAQKEWGGVAIFRRDIVEIDDLIDWPSSAGN